MDKGTKIALGLGAAAGVGAFIFWPKDSKASEKTSGDDILKAISDASAKGCADGAADKAAGKPSKVSATTGFETPTTAQQAYDKAYSECYKLGSIPVTDGGGGSGAAPPAKPATIIFDPKNAKDPVRARNLVVAIGSSPAIGVGPSDIASDGTYISLEAYAKYGPNAAGLMALQDAAGITPDGKYGAQTQRAFNYYCGGSCGLKDSVGSTIGGTGSGVGGSGAAGGSASV